MSIDPLKYLFKDSATIPTISMLCDSVSTYIELNPIYRIELRFNNKITIYRTIKKQERVKKILHFTLLFSMFTLRLYVYIRKLYGHYIFFRCPLNTNIRILSIFYGCLFYSVAIHYFYKATLPLLLHLILPNHKSPLRERCKFR